MMETSAKKELWYGSEDADAGRRASGPCPQELGTGGWIFPDRTANLDLVESVGLLSAR